MNNTNQILIDSKLIELYCTGTEADRAVIAALYGPMLAQLKQTLLVRMLNEMKTNPKSCLIVYDYDTREELEVTITIKRSPADIMSLSYGLKV